MAGTERDHPIVCPHCQTPQKQAGQQVCHHCGQPLHPRRFDYQEPGTSASGGEEHNERTEPVTHRRRFDYQEPGTSASGENQGGRRFDYQGPETSASGNGGSGDPPPPTTGGRRFDYQGPGAGAAWQDAAPPFAPSLPPLSAPREQTQPPAGKTPKRISAGLFGAILLCFFLPFVTFSCGPREISLSGAQMLTGESGIQVDDLEDIPVSVLIPSLVVVGSLVLGLVGSFFRQVAATAISTLSGAAGVAGLALFKVALTDAVEKPSDEPSGLLDTVGDALKSTGLLGVEYQSGFWLALALFLGAAGLNLVLLVLQVRQRSTPPPPWSGK